jgi:hypothetical protein
MKIRTAPTITEGYNTSLTKKAAKIAVIRGSAKRNVLAVDPAFFRT